MQAVEITGRKSKSFKNKVRMLLHIRRRYSIITQGGGFLKSYIFDFDGTLVDSMPCWSKMMLNILVKNNISYPDNIIEIITPLGNIGAAKYFIENLHAQLTVEQMMLQMDAYAYPEYRDNIVLKPGVLDYLTMLKEHDCTLHVLTASPHKMLDPCLKRNGIYDLFDNVWSIDDFGLSKSDVRIYNEAIARIGSTKSETLFFDDNIGAVKTAKQAGLYTVAVYDASAKGFTEELKRVSDTYIESFVGLDLL